MERRGEERYKMKGGRPMSYNVCSMPHEDSSRINITWLKQYYRERLKHMDNLSYVMTIMKKKNGPR